MAIRKIIKDGDDTLLKKSRPVQQIDEKLIELLDDLKETLEKVNGVGLAAPQVGILRRVAIIFDEEADNPKDRVIELINPEIISINGRQRDLEGCLSFPGKYGEVTRPQTVKVRTLTRDGKKRIYIGEGLIARAFCHEIDHLDGIVFGDRVEKWVDV